MSKKFKTILLIIAILSIILYAIHWNRVCFAKENNISIVVDRIEKIEDDGNNVDMAVIEIDFLGKCIIISIPNFLNYKEGYVIR